MGSGGGRGEFARHYDGGTISSPGFAQTHFLPPSAAETTEVIDTRIGDRLREIDAPEGQRRALRDLKDSVEDRLSSELKVERVNVVGSVAKGTQIRREGGNDIDLEVVLNREAHGDWLVQENGPRNCLNKVKSVIEGDPRFSGVEVRVDLNVVTAMIGDAKVDIAPAFTNEQGGVLIPDTSGNQTWVRTNPRMSKRLLEVSDKRHAGQVVPLIRLAKDWNARNGGHLRSYTVEAMCMRHFAEKPEGGEESYRSNTHEFFARLPFYLDKGAVRDPVYGDAVDGYLAPEERGVLIRKALRTKAKIEKAEKLALTGKAERAAECYRDALEA